MRRIETWERDRQFYNLRREGLTLLDIAHKFGCAEATVHKGIKRHVAKLTLEDSKTVKYIEIGVLNEIRNMARKIASATDVANKDKVAALNTMLNVVKEHAEFLGLHEPKRTDITSGNEPLQINTNVDLTPDTGDSE